ncbi:MAG: hypothetical protein IK152_04200 [Lachnospiraceae bacterium]|nr:hypothetical protein [Lachnospiraceae bacterium]
MALLKRILPWVILAGSVIMISAGIIDHGFRDVMGKAIIICLECVGIG